MLLIYGVAAITVGAVLNSAGRLLSGRETTPVRLRRFLGGQAFDALTVSLIAGGSLAALIFLGEYNTQPDLPLQVIVAGGLLVAGYLGIRLIRRRVGPAPIEGTPESGKKAT